MRATDLIEGDLIDLTPILEDYGIDVGVPLHIDISAYEYATIEGIAPDEGSPGALIIYTDQHNISVDGGYEVDLIERLGDL